MSTRHTCSPMYFPPPAHGHPGPEVGDEEAVNFERVQPAHLQHYNFVYLPCGHWFFFGALQNFYKRDPKCPLCNRSFFPNEVKWVPPNNPVALAGSLRERWIRFTLGPSFSRVRDTMWSVTCHASGAQAVKLPTSYEWQDKDDTLQIFFSIKHVTLSNGTMLHWGNKNILAVTPNGLLCEIMGVHDLSEAETSTSFAKGISVLDENLRQWGAVAVRFSWLPHADTRPFVVTTTNFEFILLLAMGTVPGGHLGLEKIALSQSRDLLDLSTDLLIPPDLMETIKQDVQMQNMGRALDEFIQRAN